MKHKTLLLNNDITVIGSKNPNDSSNSAKVILPGVEGSILTSAFKSSESEAHNFDPEKVIANINLTKEENMLFNPIVSTFYGSSFASIEAYFTRENLGYIPLALHVVSIGLYAIAHYRKFLILHQTETDPFQVTNAVLALHDDIANTNGINLPLVGDVMGG